MKSKYLFILLLIGLLVYTVDKMMQFETHLREEKQVMLYIEDESKPLLAKVSDEELREAAERSDYYFTASGDYFKSLKIKYQDDEKVKYWEDILFKGVNLGVAVPGKFPAEFSLSFDEYLEWIRMIGDMNANVIRLYTILPPEFYEAFAYYNLHHADKPVYLIQGVWTEVPASENYYEAEFVHDFEKEIIDVIDVIHGRAVLKEKPGKAAGVYSVDVSRNVAAILLGREWEPASVYKTIRENAVHQYNGDFVCMNDGNAMEAWLAQIMDFTVLYETQEYAFQHPVSFVNWLPLDPMYHNTEIIENERIREFDNDLVSIDLSRFNSTGLFYPGIYAAYHAYPYYPDFVYLQDSYADPDIAGNTRGPYFNFLRDLKQHTPGMPLIIAEYGLPSSRGDSHHSPFGMHQGGHSEADQAKLSLQLTKDIIDASCAGAIYFEWIDEWFKHNWLVMDFEKPEDDRKLWHNLENPEQNFGILALEDRKKTVDGNLSDWGTSFPGENPQVAADADASYFYIAAEVPGFDLGKDNFFIAIDTYDREKGDHVLPFSSERFENGFEFLIEITSHDSAFILVDEPYSVFTDIYSNHIPVYASRNNSDGKFIHQYMLANRSRVSLTCEKTDSVKLDRSRLQYGISSDPSTSNADWYFDEKTGKLEIRLDWHLLNVCDPPKRYVLDDKEGTRDIEYTETDAFNMIAFITNKSDQVRARIPDNSVYSYIWDTWTEPHYTERLKPIYSTLKDYFKDLTIAESVPSEEGTASSFRISDFYENKPGAVSISFDNSAFSQYQFGMPLLKKYGIKGSFGIIQEFFGNSAGMPELNDDAQARRLSTREAKEIAIDNEIAIQALPGVSIDQEKVYLLSEEAETQVGVLHGDRSSLKGKFAGFPVFARKSPGTLLSQENYNGVAYSLINSGLSQPELNELLGKQGGRWTIFVYHHLYDSPSEIPHQIPGEASKRLFTQKADFEQQVRLMRNHDYWIASESEVSKYIKERLESAIRTETYRNIIFLRVINQLDEDVYDQPLTIEFRSDARIITVEGSESDGTYTNKDGVFLLNVLPNKEIVIELPD